MATDYKTLFNESKDSSGVGGFTIDSASTSDSSLEKQLNDLSNLFLSTQLNIDYSNFDNFIKFGSAYDRFSHVIEYLSTYNSASSDSDNQDWFNEMEPYGRYVYNVVTQYTTPYSSRFPTDASLISSANAQTYITSSLVSASLYDLSSSAYIKNFFDDIVWEDQDETIKNYLLSIAGLYDKIYLYINHLPKTKQVNYTNYNNVPYSLMSDFFMEHGFKTYSFYTDYDLQNYLSTLSGSGVNVVDIRNEIWKKISNSLIYILKSKGTVESFRSLMKCHGVEDNAYKIKEFASGQRNIQLGRRKKTEIAYWAHFTGSKYTYYDALVGWGAIEFNCKFDPYVGFEDGYGQTQILNNFKYVTSSMVGMDYGTGDWVRLYAVRTPNTTKGYLVLTSSVGGPVTSSLLNIFDGDVNHVCLQTYNNSVTASINRSNYLSASISGTFSSSLTSETFYWGIGGDSTTLNINAEMCVNGVMIWTSKSISSNELKEHSRNYTNASSDNFYDLFNGNIMLGVWNLNDCKTNAAINTQGGFMPMYSTDTKLTYVYTGAPDNENIFSASIIQKDMISTDSDFSNSDNKIRIGSELTNNINHYANDYNLISIEQSLTDRIEDFVSRTLNEKNLGLINGIRPIDIYSVNTKEYIKNTMFLTEYYMNMFPNYNSFFSASKYYDHNFFTSLKQLTPVNVKLLVGSVVENPSYIQDGNIKIYYPSQTQENNAFGGLDSFGNLAGMSIGSWYNNKAYDRNKFDARQSFSNSKARCNDLVGLANAQYQKSLLQSGSVKSVNIDVAVSPANIDRMSLSQSFLNDYNTAYNNLSYKRRKAN